MTQPTGAAVVGNGVVGQRVVKRLGLAGPDRDVHIVDDRITDVSASRRLDQVGVVVLAHTGHHTPAAIALIDRGISVVSVGDHVADVESLMTLHDRALATGATVVVGAGMSPGLTGLIARYLASQLDQVDEIHVALHGTAGPACARQHHRALAGEAWSIDNGERVAARAGTGRELAWFPEPVGAYDCYRAELPLPMVLRDVFPTATRITARLSANRRDRFTSRLPMLTPPSWCGGVRGATADGARDTLIAGVAEMVGTASAATATAYAEAVLSGGLRAGVVLPGDPVVDTMGLLTQIERFGVRLQEFTGVPSA